MNETKLKKVQKELRKYNSDISREGLNLLFILAVSPESEEEATEVCNTYLPNSVDMLGAENRIGTNALDPFYQEFLKFIDQVMTNLSAILSSDNSLGELKEIIEELVTLLKDYNTLSKKEFLELSLNTAIGAMDALKNKFDDLASKISDESFELKQLFNFTNFLKEELELVKNNLPNGEPIDVDYHATLEKVCTFFINTIVMANFLTIMVQKKFEIEDDEDYFEDDFDFEDEEDDYEPVFDPEDKRVFELKFTLMYTDPPVYRTIQIPAGYNLDSLHHVIQNIFEWDDDHLYEFFKNKQQYNPRPNPFRGEIASSQVLLSEIFKRKGSKIRYVYDFGDNWLIEISLLKTHKNIKNTYPVCIDAYGTSPEEDSGGIMGYLDMIDEGELAENEYDVNKINKILIKRFKDLLD